MNVENLPPSAQRVQAVLTAHGLDLTVVEFPASTRTAQQAAETIGCTVGQIAKSLIFKGARSARPILVIASGTNRVNEQKIQEYIGEALEKADATFVREQTGFAIGGVPPVGHTQQIVPLIDEDLMKYDEIWAAAGTPFASFGLSPADLVKITGGKIVSVV